MTHHTLATPTMALLKSSVESTPSVAKSIAYKRDGPHPTTKNETTIDFRVHMRERASTLTCLTRALVFRLGDDPRVPIHHRLFLPSRHRSREGAFCNTQGMVARRRGEDGTHIAGRCGVSQRVQQVWKTDGTGEINPYSRTRDWSVSPCLPHGREFHICVRPLQIEIESRRRRRSGIGAFHRGGAIHSLIVPRMHAHCKPHIFFVCCSSSLGTKNSHGKVLAVLGDT